MAPPAKAITSPMPYAWYPTLVVFIVAIGLILTASFFMSNFAALMGVILFAYLITVEGFKMNLIYYDIYQATRLEKFVIAYGEFLKANKEQHVYWKRASTMDEVLREADVISLHAILDKTTYHLINKKRLATMKKEAILVNCSKGPVVDEVALVEHLKQNPMFRVGFHYK